MSPATGWDAARAWRLHPSVGLRGETFGALAYHFGTRRLTFLKDVLLADVVRSLADHRDGSSALAAAGVGQDRRDRYDAALHSLVLAEVICARD